MNARFLRRGLLIGSILATVFAGTAYGQVSQYSGPSSATSSGPTTLTGDVTGTGTGTFATTLTNGVVTLPKLANLAANSILGNNTGSPATPLALTTAQAKTLLAIANTDVSGLGTASTINTGTSGHTIPFLDGGNTYSGVTTVSGDVRTTSTNMFRLENGNTGIPAASAGTGLEIAGNATNGGTQIQALDRPFTAFKPIWMDGSAISLRPGGTAALVVSTTGAVLTGTLTVGSTVSLNSSGVLQAAGFPALTGDVTTTAGALGTTIANNATTYAKFQQVAASSLVGNATGSLANATGITLAGGLGFSGTTLTAAGALTPTSVASTGAISGTTIAGSSSILSSGATGGVGYATGAGGAVTQITSRATGVTNNKACGAITMFSAAGSATWATFVVTDSAVAATDTIIANEKSGTNLYMLAITGVGSGTFNLSFATTGGTATDAPVINYCVVKGVAA